MVQMGVGRLVVVDPREPGLAIGMLSRSDILKSRARLADEEIRRERFIGPNRAADSHERQPV